MVVKGNVIAYQYKGLTEEQNLVHYCPECEKRRRKTGEETSPLTPKNVITDENIDSFVSSNTSIVCDGCATQAWPLSLE